MNLNNHHTFHLNDNHIKNEITPLTSFRFITAFVVFLFHCKLHFGFNTGIIIIDAFIGNGAVFMSGFFVLSGYIMCYVYQNKDFRKKNDIFKFYIKRFAKIYPVYLVGTIIYFAFVHPKIPYATTEWIRIVVNDLFLTQAFFSSMFSLGINSGTWSISVEAFFYFLFPLIMVLFSKRPFLLLSVGLFITLIININIFAETCNNVHYVKSYYSNPVMRLNEFIIGISFYLLGSKGHLDKLPKILRSASFIFILIFALTILTSHKNFYMGLQLFIVPLFALLIFCFHNITFGPMKNSKTINYLGKISYSFYMWQFIVMFIGRHLITTYPIKSWCVMASMLLLNIFLSSLSYHLIEETCRKFIIKNVTFKI